MWNQTLLLRNVGPNQFDLDEFVLEGLHCRPVATVPQHLPRHFVDVIQGQDWLNSPVKYSQIQICPIWLDEHDPTHAWLDPDAHVTDITPRQKRLLRDWLIAQSGIAFEQATPQVQALLRDVTSTHRMRVYRDDNTKLHPPFVTVVDGRTCYLTELVQVSIPEWKHAIIRLIQRVIFEVRSSRKR
jgi:hypothetical protein